MSWMMAFRGSRGSSTPSARPVTTSYCPAVPNDGQPVLVQNAGEILLRMVMRVTRASTAEGQKKPTSKTNNGRNTADGAGRFEGIDGPPEMFAAPSGAGW